MDELEMQKVYSQKVYQKLQGQNLKYAIETMGCQLNENDSEKLCGMLEEMGYTKADSTNEADFVVFNTCCVRENAEERLFGRLGDIKKLKEKNGTIIAVGGCMMQEPVMQEKMKKSYNYVDIIFGTHTLHKLPENVYKVLETRKKIKDVLDIDGEVYEGLPIRRDSKYKASVTIMYGCNNFCTYCIVPYVRGRERSRKPELILEEVRGLVKEGYKEITLLGQNVNSYVGDDKIRNFADLLVEVNKIEGIEVIRFVSPHPKDFTDDVIDAIAKSDKVSKIIHLPLQSGSTNVLKAMNRKYTKEAYLNLVQKMRERIPGVTFSTDIIVGFPGETEEDFEDTLDVAEKVNFEQIFMFIYSVREGTVAEKMPNHIPEEIKHKRFDRLKALYESKVDANNEKYLNTIQKVLIEGTSKNNENMLSARTNSNKVVVFENKDGFNIGDIVNVKIVSAHKWYLKGELVNEGNKN